MGMENRREYNTGFWPFVVRLDDGTFLEAAFTVVK